MAKPNYRQVFSKRNEVANKLKIICPNITNNSGIYFYTRQKEEGGFAYYIGKSVTILDRCISHDIMYNQRIDISLKKRGYFSQSNPYGWKLNFLYFPKQSLDEKERFYIELYKSKENGECYNVESGGTLGKEIIGERKEPKNYTDGLKQGRKNAIKEVKVFFDKYLDFIIKDKPNKVKERKYNEFKEWLNEDN